MSLSSRRLGDPSEMLCPCVHCRNVCHQSCETLLEHLVIRGTDQKYKSCMFWTKHGETRPDKSADVYSSEQPSWQVKARKQLNKRMQEHLRGLTGQKKLSSEITF